MNCPHCTKDLGAEVVSKSDHLARIAAKDEKIRELQPKADQAELLRAAEERSRAELVALQGKMEARTLMDELGVKDERVLAGLRSIHGQEMASTEEGKRVDLRTFLAQTDNPLVRAVLPKATPGTPATPAAPGTPASPATPATPAAPGTPATPVAPATPAVPAQPDGPAVTPASPGPRIATPDVQRFIQSAEYRALSKEQKAVKLGELEAQWQAQATQGPTV